MLLTDSPDLPSRSSLFEFRASGTHVPIADNAPAGVGLAGFATQGEGAGCEERFGRGAVGIEAVDFGEDGEGDVGGGGAASGRCGRGAGLRGELLHVQERVDAGVEFEGECFVGAVDESAEVGMLLLGFERFVRAGFREEGLD